jgi:SAM-dependent methyltransferase
MHPKCPLCGVTSHHRVYRPFRSPVQIWQCSTCRFVFCFPLPLVSSSSAGQHSVLTDEAYTAGLLTIPEWKQDRYNRQAEGRYQHYSSTLEKCKFRLLEIGCGSCGLAAKYQQLGVEYYGIDLDSRVVDAARKSGVRNVRRADFLDHPEDERFDVITFSQVLEHIKTPVQFLTKVHAMLLPGGVVHCDVPNHTSLPSLVYRLPLNGVRWGAITYPHHLFAYTRHSLQVLFERFFSVEVFDATVTEPVWGQATPLNSGLAKIGPLLKLLHAGSLLVAYGVKIGTSVRTCGVG